MRARDANGLRNRLGDLMAEADRIRHLLSAEISYREDRLSRSLEVLALDFDVIYDFLHGGQRRDNVLRDARAFASIQFTESLLRRKDTRFTILPGSLHEFVYYWTRLLGDLPRFATPSDFLASVDPENGIRHQKELRAYLVGMLHHSRSALTSAKCAIELLASPSYVSLEDCCADPEQLSADSSYFDTAFAYLAALRPSSSRTLANHNDCINLAIVLNARDTDLHLPLVTRSPTVLQAFHSAWRASRHGDQPTQMIFDPYVGLLRLGLQSASDGELADLKKNLDALSVTIQRYLHASGNRHELTSPAIGGLEKDLTDLVGQLTEVREGIEISWSRPGEGVPEDIDLDRFAETILETSSELEDEIRSLLRRAERTLRFATKVVSSLASRSSAAAKPRALLEAAARSDQFLYIEKLVYIAEGGSMDDRSVRQIAGRDLNSVIDSFKGNIVVVRSLGNKDLEERLSAFLDAVVSSNLEDDKKAVILHETQTIARDVATNGRLGARAQLLWNGIKEAIAEVPKAAAAWKAISDLWT